MSCKTILHHDDADFMARFDALRAQASEVEGAVEAAVREIISDVRARGDEALIALTEKLDRHTPDTLHVSADEIAEAEAGIDGDTLAALDEAATRIARYHERQTPRDDRFMDGDGVMLGHRWTAVDAAGLYVPGGTAGYPSSVLMNAIPARIAGVARVVMVSPAPDGAMNPLTLAAARRAGVHEIYRIGGAQAVAALAYGTETIAPVDVIVGPGNAYVAAAKKQVFGQVGIDTLAGPSEILIVADADNDPDWIAADLLAQAEHDAHARPLLICDDAAFAKRVEAAVETALAALPRADTARASWEGAGAILILADLADAPPLVDALAPEHLALAVENPEAMLGAIRHAGAVFLGRHTPEALGDYIAGPNHVLPTGRAARYASGLSVADFMKRSSIIGCDAEGLARLGASAQRLAQAEGLDAHARSIAIRSNKS